MEAETVSMSLLLEEVVHGFLGTCCHGLKLGHKVLGYVYSPVTLAYKLIFTLHLSQLHTVVCP